MFNIVRVQVRIYFFQYNIYIQMQEGPFLPRASPLIDTDSLRLFLATLVMKSLNQQIDLITKADIRKLQFNVLKLREISYVFKTRATQFWALGRYQQAKSLYMLTLLMSPEQKAYCYVGNCCMILQDVESAKYWFKQCLALYPKSANAYNFLGVAHMQVKEQDEAQDYYKKALNLDQYYLAALNNTGSLYSQQQKYQQALPYFQRVINRFHHLQIVLQISKQTIQSLIVAYQGTSLCKYSLGFNQEAKLYCLKTLRMLSNEDKQIKCSTLWYLGEIEKKQGSFKEAIQHFYQALSIDQNHVRTLYSLGLLYFQKSKYEEARVYLEKLLNVNQKYQALNLLGRVFIKLQDYSKARQCFNKSINLSPQFHQAYYNMGILHQHLGMYQEAKSYYQIAIRYYQIVLQKRPSFQAYNNLGIAYQKVGQLHDAIECLEEAIKIYPNQAQLFNSLSQKYSEIGDDQNAINFAQSAIKLDPQFAEAYNNYGLLLFNKYNYNQAFINYKRATQLNPKDAVFFNNLANSYQRLGKNNQSFQCYKKAIQLNPKYSSPYWNLGEFNFRLGNHEVGLAQMKKAVQLDPNNIKLNCRYGQMLKETGSQEQAKHYYVKSLEQKALNPQAYRKMGQLYLTQRNVDDAEECFKKALLLNQNQTMALFNLGIIYQQKDNKKSSRYLNDAIKSAKSYWDYYQLGEKLLQKFYFPLAFKCYRHAILLKPEKTIVYYLYAIALQRYDAYQKWKGEAEQARLLNEDNPIFFDQIDIMFQLNQELGESCFRYLNKSIFYNTVFKYKQARRELTQFVRHYLRERKSFTDKQLQLTIMKSCFQLYTYNEHIQKQLGRNKQFSLQRMILCDTLNLKDEFFMLFNKDSNLIFSNPWQKLFIQQKYREFLFLPAKKYDDLNEGNKNKKVLYISYALKYLLINEAITNPTNLAFLFQKYYDLKKSEQLKLRILKSTILAIKAEAVSKVKQQLTQINQIQSKKYLFLQQKYSLETNQAVKASYKKILQLAKGINVQSQPPNQKSAKILKGTMKLNVKSEIADFEKKKKLFFSLMSLIQKCLEEGQPNNKDINQQFKKIIVKFEKQSGIALVSQQEVKLNNNVFKKDKGKAEKFNNINVRIQQSEQQIKKAQKRIEQIIGLLYSKLTSQDKLINIHKDQDFYDDFEFQNEKLLQQLFDKTVLFSEALQAKDKRLDYQLYTASLYQLTHKQGCRDLVISIHNNFVPFLNNQMQIGKFFKLINNLLAVSKSDQFEEEILSPEALLEFTFPENEINQDQEQLLDPQNCKSIPPPLKRRRSQDFSSRHMQITQYLQLLYPKPPENKVDRQNRQRSQISNQVPNQDGDSQTMRVDLNNDKQEYTFPIKFSRDLRHPQNNKNSVLKDQNMLEEVQKSQNLQNKSAQNIRINEQNSVSSGIQAQEAKSLKQQQMNQNQQLLQYESSNLNQVQQPINQPEQQQSQMQGLSQSSKSNKNISQDVTSISNPFLQDFLIQNVKSIDLQLDQAKQHIFQNHLLFIKYLCGQRKNWPHWIAKYCIRSKDIDNNKQFSFQITRGLNQFKPKETSSRSYINLLYEQKDFGQVLWWIYCLVSGIKQLQQFGIFHPDLQFRNTIRVNKKCQQMQGRLIYQIIDFDWAFKVYQLKDQKMIALMMHTRTMLKCFIKADYKRQSQNNSNSKKYNKYSDLNKPRHSNFVDYMFRDISLASKSKLIEAIQKRQKDTQQGISKKVEEILKYLRNYMQIYHKEQLIARVRQIINVFELKNQFEELSEQLQQLKEVIGQINKIQVKELFATYSESYQLLNDEKFDKVLTLLKKKIQKYQNLSQKDK